MGALVFLSKKFRAVPLLIIAAVVFFTVDTAVADEVPGATGNHLIGVAAGYYFPAESDFKDYYGENLFPVYGFYECFFSRHFSIEVESGFLKKKGYLLTESGETTQFPSEIILVPVSSSLNFNFRVWPYIIGYIGAGGDYWYCKEQNANKPEQWKTEEWVGGFHGKAGVRLYNTDERYSGIGAIIEGSYSQIDRFGGNETDIGGWSLKLGFFKHF
jgi:hypothetical protein